MPTNWSGPVGIDVAAATSQLGMLDSWEWASVAALASAKVKGVNQVLISRPPDVTDVTGVSIARGMPELSPYFSVDWK
jgi:hypothetical protein